MNIYILRPSILQNFEAFRYLELAQLNVSFLGKEHVPRHRLKTPAEKKKFVRSRAQALRPVQFTIVS
jgi:hypothetical protein